MTRRGIEVKRRACESLIYDTVDGRHTIQESNVDEQTFNVFEAGNRWVGEAIGLEAAIDLIAGPLPGFTETRDTGPGDDDPMVARYKFEAGVSVENAMAALEARGVAMNGERCKHSYDCCGNWYPGRVHAEVVDGRPVLTQYWQQNI